VLTVFADLSPLGAIFLGLVPVGAIGFVLAFAGADLAYFDPRPLLGRAGDRLLVEAVNARFLLRDAALTVAALLSLLTIRPEALR
jgi:hypothetical protein